LGGAPTETEVKLRVASAEEARLSLARIGARRVRARHFEDNVLYDDTQGSLGRAGVVLRLRTTGEGGALTFKGPRRLEGGIKSRDEWETPVGDPSALAAILERLGYRPLFRYQKYRESWTRRGQQVEVDETPIGPFVEIEGDAEGIHAVASELGYGPADYVSESYAGLFLAGGGTGDMVFPT
jgi:adenylate cyclase class 2